MKLEKPYFVKYYLTKTDQNNCISITDVAIYAASFKNPKKYIHINEFINIEEIKESTSEILDNFKFLSIKRTSRLKKENLVIMLNVDQFSEKNSSNIKIPKKLKLKILQINNHLLTLISPKVKLKILITIQVRL